MQILLSERKFTYLLTFTYSRTYCKVHRVLQGVTDYDYKVCQVVNCMMSQVLQNEEVSSKQDVVALLSHCNEVSSLSALVVCEELSGFYLPFSRVKQQFLLPFSKKL